MVAREAGSVTIGAKMDTQEVEQGLSRIDKGLKRVEGSNKSAFADTVRLRQAATGLGKALTAVGTAGVAGLAALARQAPQTADEMAKIQNAMRDLTWTAGRIFEPLFDKIGSDLLPAINRQLDEGMLGKTLNVGINAATEGLGDLSSLMGGSVSDIQNLFPKSALAAAGAAAGFKIGGFQGMIIGAALGYLAGTAGAQELESSQYFDANVMRFGKGAETATAIQEINDLSIKDRLTLSPEALGRSYQLASSAIQDFGEIIVDLWRSATSKEVTFAQLNAQRR